MATPRRHAAALDVVDRTATFVFFLGDRFLSTTAYVPGAIAGSYHFTSALAVQLLKALEPELEPLLKSPASEAAPMPISEALPVVTELRKTSEGAPTKALRRPGDAAQQIDLPVQRHHQTVDAFALQDRMEFRSMYR